MNTTAQLTKRNMTIYFRNKSTVFFSFLSMIIIITLYALFLKDINVDQLKASYGGNEGDISWLITSWMMSGIIIVNAVNITIAALSVMVEDKEKQYIKDLIVAPIKRYQIVLSYIISSIFIGVIMSLVSFSVAELYIYLNGGELLNLTSTIKVLIAIVLSVIMISSMGFLGYSFIKNEKAVATISTIVGTFIGFFTGVYVPIGILPEFIQNAVKLFPVTYSATILKGIFVSEPAKVVFAKAPAGSQYDYNLMMSNIITINGHTLSYNTMLLIIVFTSIIFFGLSIFRINKQKNYI